MEGSSTLWKAVKTIIIADFVMSLDNVIAIAGAAQTADPDHQIGLVVFGLVVSVPIIIWGSTLVLKLIDRFPWVRDFGRSVAGLDRRWHDRDRRKIRRVLWCGRHQHQADC